MRHGSSIAARLPRIVIAKISDQAAAVAHLEPLFAGHKRERAVVLMLTPANRLKRQLIIEGERDHVWISIPRLLVAVAQSKACGVVLAHNHPSSVCRFSDGDREVTRRLGVAFRSIGVRLHDSFVITADEWVSARQIGLL